MKEKDSKKAPKTLMPLTRVHKLNGGEDLEGNLKVKGDVCKVEPQSLLNLTRKENDENSKRELK
jgi:hypothetical protein